ncbi:hypothetical protein [Aeromonas caviae]
MVAGVTDKGYYTNSFHLDVEKQVKPLEVHSNSPVKPQS